MKSLWFAFMMVATFGSLYPFDFDLSGPPGGLLRALLDAAGAGSGRGDVAGNFVLFLPIGLTGMLALDERIGGPARFVRSWAVAVALALALQMLQVYLPSRDASLLDVVWNAGGALCGAALASFVQRESMPAAARLGGAAFVPLALIVGWLAYRLMPFVPSVDFQLFKDSLKPLVYGPLDPVACVRDGVGWVVVAYLVRRGWRGARFDRFLPFLMVVVFGLEVLIVANAVDRADVAGAVIAILVWFGFLRRMRRPEGPVVALLAGTIALSGLAPFTPRPEAAPFHWMPFQGFLSGSMYVNAQSALEKTFLYGSLVFAVQRASSRRAASVLVAFVFVGLIELAQTKFIGHSPEITDPLLVLLAAFAIFALERHEPSRALVQAEGPIRVDEPLFPPAQSRPEGQPEGKPEGRRSGRRIPGRNATGWVKLSVALRPEQQEALGRLAQEWGMSPSGAMRRVITGFADGSDASATRVADAMRLYPAGDGHGLSSNTVNLQGDHFEALLQLAHDLETSVASLTRSMVDDFLAGADS